MGQPVRDLFLFLSVLTFLGCNAEEKEGMERVSSTVLEGMVSSTDHGKVELRARKAPFTYAERVIAKDSLKDGRFHLKFREEEPGFLTFQDPDGRDRIYLEAGDSLVLRKSVQGELRFEGRGALRNRYLKKENAFNDSLSRAQDSLFKKDKGYFLEKLRERKEAYKDLRNRHFRKENGYGERFRELIEARNEIEIALMKFSYPDIHRYEHPNDSLELSEDYWTFMDTLEMSDTLLLDVPEFLGFAYDVANKYALENKGGQKNKSYRQMLFQTILEEFEGDVRDVLLTYFMLEQLRYNEERVKQGFWKAYRDEVSDTTMLDFVEKKLRREKDRPS